MEEDTEFTKLPVEDRCVHKLWKARLHGYEECAKNFRLIDDEKSPEWNKFLGLVKKFVSDSNAAAQEKGLEAVLAYVENAAVAGKTTNDVISGIVTKCIAAPKAKTKELAVQIILMYIEIEKQEAVQEELIKGTEAKNPKIVSACISTLTLALREFGPKVMNIKPLMKKIPTLLEDRDKNVRDETKALVVEIYRWLGPSFKQQLSNLKPVQLSELETEFNNLGNDKAVPNRYLRSQKPKVVSNVESNDCEVEDDDEVDDDGGNQPDIDPYDLIDPVDILSKLPKDFYDKLESKKWQERKESLEALDTLVKNPKLENGDYGECTRALKKIVAKDSNVVVVTLAVKCMAGLAGGLKKRFQPYALTCLPAILEKFKEKKQTVVVALRECADAIFLSVNIEQISEDVLAALENKNPSVKAETASFLARCLSRTPPASLNKKLLKAYTGPLLKTLNEPDPAVRDNSADAIGTALKLVGEKTMSAFLVDVDNLKMTKIKESAEKAVIHVKVAAPKKAPAARPNTAPAKVETTSKNSENESKPKRPATAAPKKQAIKKPSSVGSNAASNKKAPVKLQTEKNYSAEEVDEMAAEMLPKEILSGLVDSNWKNRLAAVEQLTTHVKQMDDVPTQIIVRVLGKKPGFKDTNFQVLKLRIELVKILAENYKFTSTVSEYCLTDITEKLGDVKNTTTASETLTAIAEVISFEFVANEVMTFAFNQKNPKVQQETLLWISKSLTEFGFTLNAKSLIENVKKAIAATNPGIRTAAISLVGTMYMFMGKPLLTFFENEKPALKQQIEQECEKFEGEVPPAPIRKAKSKKSTKQGQGDEEIDEDIEENSAPTIDLSEMIPRVDISNQLTESLINELSDKNWKVRNEAVQKISNIVSEAKLIKGSLGDLPIALAQRLSDSNIKIAQATLGLCETLATAMGPPIKQYIRALFPGFLQSLGDSKAWMRTAGISCINCWGDQCGYKEFFDGEMIGDALKSGSPIMRNEMWIWLSEKLGGIPTKQIPKEELMVCIPVLYNNLEDRNSDVRKNAQEAVLGFMLHLSYESMVRQTEKLKPGSKNAVIGVLDKVRPNLPVKPLPTKKAPPADDGSSKTVKSGGALQKASKAGIKTKGANAANKPTSARKKDDDVDTSPLLAVNNMKHQRSIDEQKLKILKWNFTTPREEFVDLLKDLMSTANVNKTLMANMFHADFRYHLKAIESLTEDLPTNSKALVSNLDLILKWLTLRFFDTNPSVLLKGLEYLQTVFNFLIEDQYHMLENEASSFIPYLIIKIGDPKDAVRNGVKALFKQIAMVYPVSKLFSYVMEGLKSKNARQRTECLDQLGVLIESYGVSVCQPSPAAALKEVAKQIADRDNSVRNAALNCIVQAYFLEGERVYKLVGQISEKDQSLLDERIKRAAKNRPAKQAPLVKAKAATQASIPANVKEVDEPSYDDDEPEEEEEEEKMEEENDENKKTPIQIEDDKYLESTFVCNKGTEYESAKLKEDTSSHEKQSKISSLDKIKSNNAVNVPVPQVKPQPIKVQPKVSGPFGLDMELLHKIESSAPVRCRVPKLIEPNLDMSESVELLNSAQPRQIIPISPPKLLQPNSVDNISPSLNMNKEDNLDRTILGMASLDLSVAIMSMNAMETYLKSHHVTMLQSKEDKFINSVNMQLKLLQTYPLHHGNSQISKGFRNTFMLILTFYDTGILGKNVSTQNLKDLVDQLIGFLAENKLERMSDSEAYVRVINNIVLKIIDNSDHTTIICVLIKLLHERADSKGPYKYEDLIMKCLWKTVKTIPNWAGDLDYDAILLEAHNFFKDYPTSWWKKQKKPDTSMRTIKTVLHSMTQVKGSTILCHLTQINNTNESELRAYLMRLISTFKPDDVTNKGISKSSNNQIQNQKLSVQQQLSEIFKKIGSEQHKREGLAQLYDFKLRHPEADVKPYLEKSHQYFQDYVEQGLKEIDRTRKNQNLMTDQVNNRTGNYRLGSTTEGGKSVLEASTLQRLERLRALEAQCQNRS